MKATCKYNRRRTNSLAATARNLLTHLIVDGQKRSLQEHRDAVQGHVPLPSAALPEAKELAADAHRKAFPL